MRLLRSSDLDKLVIDAVSADSATEGPVQVQEHAFTDLCERLTNCDDLLEDYDRWAEPAVADLIQLLVTAVSSIAKDPVLAPGDNAGFALIASCELARRNASVLDVEACDFFFRLLFSQLAADGPTDSDLADLRCLLSDHLYGKRQDEDEGSVRLVGTAPASSPGLTAFVAPPLTGLSGEPLARMEALCVEVEETLRALGFVEILQPIRYSNPDLYPIESHDSELVRRSDIDNILRSDLVVAFIVRPATGLGTVLAWAERGGLAQMLVTDDDAAQSPLPRSSPGVLGISRLVDKDLAESLRAFVEQYRTALADHVAQRSRRTQVQAADLKRFRDAFMRVGRAELARALPGWLSVNRVVEILRTVDHFSVVTNEEYVAIQSAFELELEQASGRGANLTSVDITEADQFARSVGLSRREYSELLRAAIAELEHVDLAVSHRRGGRAWWAELRRRMT